MRKRTHRAQDLRGHWVFGNYIEWCGAAHIAHMDEKGALHFTPVKTETVGDFIDRIDKDGRAVYEGDIVKYSEEIDGEVFEDVLLIGWGDEVCGFLGRSLDNPKALPADIETQEIISKYVTVIGNKWDNPELLEASV